jgi:thymidylate synthase
MQIWDPLYDRVDTRDLPCTLGFGFRIRGDGLHMSSTMRSQDVWLGLAYDLFMFGQLGWTIANVLGVEFVSITHHVYSLHLYERNMEAVDQLHSRSERHYFEPRGFGWNGEDYEFARARAEQIYRKERPIMATTSETWFSETLHTLERQVRRDNFSS